MILTEFCRPNKICIFTIGSQPKFNINGKHFTILIDWKFTYWFTYNLNEMEKKKRPNWFNGKSKTNRATNSIVAKERKKRTKQMPCVRVFMRSVFFCVLQAWVDDMRFHVLIMLDKHASLLKLNTTKKQKQIFKIMKEMIETKQLYGKNVYEEKKTKSNLQQPGW